MHTSIEKSNFPDVAFTQPPYDALVPVAARCCLILSALAAGCVVPAKPPGFRILDAETSGIDFVNRVEGDSTFNILTYPYFYDGGGVAAGDLSGDGLADLYFVASEGPNRLFVNRGGLRFEDVTEQAGVAGSADWSKGVTLADVNGDGLLDIYLSNVDILNRRSRNELFVNNGDGSFSERAAEFGLDFVGYGTQATFFDYDADGDLDVYLVNHSVHTEDTHGPDTLRYEHHPLAGDRLLRNEGGVFRDVSEGAGVYGGRIGYGLAAIVSDLDADGCLDLFVSNDFHEHDYLYFNNCDGTFTESIRSSVGHTSRSSMGNEAGDIDNDGLPDLVVLDMLPARQDILNSSVSFERWQLYETKIRLGYHHQEIRNTVQWNRGKRRFSEVGYLAGVFATDWSWAPLLADFDNDGYLDLFVTNGIYRRPNDRDFSALMAQPPMMRRIGVSSAPPDPEIIADMPSVAIPNYIFRGQGALQFEDVTSTWGLQRPSFSNGAAYADLDNDGDLDLVVNNVNGPAWIIENRISTGDEARSLQVHLKGDAPNTFGVGSRVVVVAGGRRMSRELVTTRGWQSSVAPRLHFGLGTADVVDTLLVLWPDARCQTLTNLRVDTLVTIEQRAAHLGTCTSGSPPGDPLFVDRTGEMLIPFRHQENEFFELNREGLMPRLVSREGPALSVGDVNGDDLEDVFVGGARGQPASLLLQIRNGSFAAANDSVWQLDRDYEDVDAAFFDADGDSDLDLYVVSAGNEFWGTHPMLADRLYLNDGRGGFTNHPERLPEMRTNGCCVAPADFDADGDIDLFVGGRVVAREYGAIPRSYLLQNDGSGSYEDVAEIVAPGLSTAGMITSAGWGDFDADGRPDLAIAGEWMGVRVLLNAGGRLMEPAFRTGLESQVGLWTALLVEDLDGDGDSDIVAGNLGHNSLLRASEDEPLRLLIGDIDADGRNEHFLTTRRFQEDYLVLTPDELLVQVPSLGRRYRRFSDFGTVRVDDVIEGSHARSVQEFEVTTLSTVIAENRGDATFHIREAPLEAQLAPVHAIAAMDIDGDQDVDLVLGGNTDRTRRIEGRLDASYGALLRQGDGFKFESVPPRVSGLYLEAMVTGLSLVHTADRRTMLVAARNDQPLQVLELRSDARR